MRDAGNLLTRAGFTLPGVDVDEYVVKYKSGEDNLSFALVNVILVLTLYMKFMRVTSCASMTEIQV